MQLMGDRARIETLAVWLLGSLGEGRTVFLRQLSSRSSAPSHHDPIKSTYLPFRMANMVNRGAKGLWGGISSVLWSLGITSFSVLEGRRWAEKRQQECQQFQNHTGFSQSLSPVYSLSCEQFPHLLFLEAEFTETPHSFRLPSFRKSHQGPPFPLQNGVFYCIWMDHLNAALNLWT